jgi:hypothetical protein
MVGDEGEEGPPIDSQSPLAGETYPYEVITGCHTTSNVSQATLPART